jgi:hypothetical protein
MKDRACGWFALGSRARVSKLFAMSNFGGKQVQRHGVSPCETRSATYIVQGLRKPCCKIDVNLLVKTKRLVCCFRFVLWKTNRCPTATASCTTSEARYDIFNSLALSE